MDKSTYLLLAIALITIVTGVNYMLAGDSGGTRSYGGSGIGAAIGGAAGGHK